MMDKISERQWNAWLIVAILGPILSVAGQSNWLGILPVAVLCPILCCTCGKYRLFPKWLCVAELIWLAVFLGAIAYECGTCWGDEKAIPIIMILVAALGCKKGSVPPSRIGAALLWLVIPAAVLVILAGLPDVNPTWIKMKPRVPGSSLICLLLVPCLSAFLPQVAVQKKKWLPWLLGIAAVGASMLIQGTLGVEIAETTGNGFYELSKGITLFGVAERFEALIACTLTLSWFALFCLIFSTAYHLSVQISPTITKYSIWSIAALAALLLYIMPNMGQMLAVGTLIFWGLIPDLTQVIDLWKKVEKK